MKLKILIPFLSFFFLLNGVIFSKGNFISGDSTKDANMFGHHKKHPVVEVRVSNATFDFENLTFPLVFDYTGTVQINLGYRTFNKNHPAGKYFEKYLSLAYSSNTFVNKDIEGLPINSEVWQMEAVNEVGYHHQLGMLGVTPYYSSGYFLYSFDNSINFVVPAVYTGEVIPIKKNLDRFEGKVHFGKNFEQGLKIGLGQKFSLDVGYTEQLFFPRFMTWKFLGSEILYGFSRVALDKFTRSIVQDSPLFGSVIDVALVSGMNYLVYYFQKKDMNWPFNSETPITNKGVKIGFSLIF